MKNRNISLLTIILLSVPTGYLCAAAESAKGLALRLAAEAADRALINQALATDELGFPEDDMQRAIINSLDPADTDNKEQEEVKEESAEVVAARATGTPITMDILQKTNINKKWHMPNSATYTKKPTTERGESLIEMIANNTPFYKGIAELIENYEKPIMTNRTIIFEDGSIHAIAIAPNGNSIAVAIWREIAIFNTENGTLLKTFENPSLTVAFSPDGQQIASGSKQNIHIWNIETGQCLRTLEGHSGTTSVAFSPDGQQIVSGYYNGTVQIWNIETGQCLRTLERDNDNLLSVVKLSPDGLLRAHTLGENFKNIAIWNVKTDQCLRTLEGHSKISSVAFSPDGQHIASGYYDGTVQIWSIETGECLRTLEGHQNSISSLAFSPDGRHIASEELDHTTISLNVFLLNVETGERFHALKGYRGSEENQSGLESITFSPDGQHIVYTTYNQIYIFDISKIINNIDFIYEIVAPGKVKKEKSKTRKNQCDSCVIS